MNSIKDEDQLSIEQILFVKNKLEDMTISELNQASLINKESGIPIKIVTLKYESNFFERKDTLFKGYSNISFLNLYEYFRGNEHKPLPHNEIKSCKEMGKVNKTKKYFRLNKQKNIELIKVQEYDGKQGINKTAYLFAGLPIEEFFHSDDGLCYIKIKRLYNGRRENTYLKIELFDIFDGGNYYFINESDLEMHFLKHLIKTETTLIIGDINNMYRLNELFKSVDSIYTMCRISDKNIPFIPDSLVLRENMLSQYDAIIFSNNKEKKYLTEKCGRRDNYFVLPFFLKSDWRKGNNDIREITNNQIFIHINDSIQLETIIRAFRVVNDKMPNTILNIYSSQQIDEINKNLIKDLDLENNVIIVNDSDLKDIYKSAAFSVSLSTNGNGVYEILKSLSCGCPVISFDYGYEVRGLISNGINGFLVKNNSIKDLSDKILYLLKNSHLLEKMSKAALISIESNTEDMFLEKWNNLIQKITDSKRKKIQLTDAVVFLLDCGWNDLDSFYFINKLHLAGIVNNSKPNVYFGLISRSTGEKRIYKSDIIKIDCRNYKIYNEINFKEADLSQGIWDTVIIVEWENNFFQKRVGHFKTDIAKLGILKNIIYNRILTPYFTTKGDNLSFKVGRYIPEKDKVKEYEFEFKNLIKEYTNKKMG